MKGNLPTPTARDRFAVRLANKALKLATPEYQQWYSGIYRYGMNAAARDVLENREPPEDWEVYAQRARDMVEEGDE